MSQLARFLGVHTTLISQVIKELKSLTTDQAAKSAEFLGLNELETEYFVLLVQLDRAGNSAAKDLFKKQIKRVKDQSQNISKRIKSEKKLTDEQRAVFYSDWAYSAIRQAVVLPGISDLNSISAFLGLPRKRVQKILDFLLQTGLCKTSGGKLNVGPSSTHVEAGSPWVRVHHMNWRQKAIQSLDKENPEHLHYTSPLTIAAKDADLVRERIIQLIEQINTIVDPSPSEELFCLNLDWFKLG
jgi:uncharacterized protein (TIGR02147 family)